MVAFSVKRAVWYLSGALKSVFV